MAAPSTFRRPPGVRRGRNSNKHKRLFEGGEGSLPNGEKVSYITTQGEKLLEGEVVISVTGPSGIKCYCCNQVISCSQFEAHAGRGSRRAPYDNIFTSAGLTLKAIAAMLPELEDEVEDGADYDLHNVADGCREVINELDTVAGGCVLCHEVDFQRGGFGPRTVLFCDQCEREFHVGCLKAAGKCDLQAVPEGDWFCSQECMRINQLLGTYIQAGQMEIPASPGHTWQLLRGKDGTHGTAWSLRAAQELLQESFDPIMDLSTNTDLLPLMIYARQYGEWDYKNVHVMLLRHKGKPVVAAIMRIFGPQLAELPLIATKLTARRQGHARVLLEMFDKLLIRAGVHRLCLPAAHETVLTWRQGFHFVDMPEEDVKLAKQQLRILVFPGTEMLWKDVQGVGAPDGHHILAPLPERETAEDLQALAARVAANAVSLALWAVEGDGPPPSLQPLRLQQAPAMLPAESSLQAAPDQSAHEKASTHPSASLGGRPHSLAVQSLPGARLGWALEAGPCSLLQPPYVSQPAAVLSQRQLANPATSLHYSSASAPASTGVNNAIHHGSSAHPGSNTVHAAGMLREQEGHISSGVSAPAAAVAPQAAPMDTYDSMFAAAMAAADLAAEQQMLEPPQPQQQSFGTSPSAFAMQQQQQQPPASVHDVPQAEAALMQQPVVQQHADLPNGHTYQGDFPPQHILYYNQQQMQQDISFSLPPHPDAPIQYPPILDGLVNLPGHELLVELGTEHMGNDVSVGAGLSRAAGGQQQEVRLPMQQSMPESNAGVVSTEGYCVVHKLAQRNGGPQQGIFPGLGLGSSDRLGQSASFGAAAAQAGVTCATASSVGNCRSDMAVGMADAQLPGLPMQSVQQEESPNSSSHAAKRARLA